MTERVLDAGEILFEIGDDGDLVFVVLDGELDVLAPTAAGGEVAVGRLQADDVVGEITAVIGGQRTATVRARTTTRVLELANGAFEEWLDERPARAVTLADEARRRMDRTRVARVVAELVGPSNAALIDEMTDAVDWVTIDAGQPLFEQGDHADAAYILVGGQMRVTAQQDGVTTLDTRIGRGDLIGEMGIIEQAPRNATARAIRDCSLARIPRTTFERFTAEHPAIMIPLVRKVLGRIDSRGTSTPHAGAIAVVVTDPDADPALAELLVDETSRYGPSLLLDAERVERFLGRRDIANAARGSAADTRLTEFLHEVDVAHRWVVFDCGDPESDWARRALRSADRVAVVASARPGPEERGHIDRVRALLESLGDYDLWAVQTEPNTTTLPIGSAALQRMVGADRILHITRGDERSARRLGRLLSGNGLGVAFSGGGARSYGQIGAIKAMDELGLTIDAVAGTSMGSVMAAFIGLVDDAASAVEVADREFTGIKLLDYTLPFTSLVAGESVTERMEAFFGGYDIEDMRLPFTCLSTNLTKASLHEHRSGNLVHAMRASVSLPGVFPPVPHNGDLLVDGGVLENLPARPLREDPAISTVIAIDVAPPDGPRAKVDFGHSLSGLDIVKSRLRREKFPTPGLPHTVISAMLVGSAQARTNALSNEAIDLYVSLNLSGIKLLDFDALTPAIDRGYRDALPIFKEWIASRPTM